MVIPFDPMRVVQAAATLARLEPHHRISRLRLLKFLYIADRELLQSRGRPITGDRAVAMDHGPVLSATYDLMKGSGYASPLWEEYFRSEGRDIHLIHDPGVGKLTQREIEKLADVSARFVEWNDWAVAEYTHGYEEWKKNQPTPGSRILIPIEDVLEALGMSGQKDALLANEKAELAMGRILA